MKLQELHESGKDIALGDVVWAKHPTQNYKTLTGTVQKITRGRITIKHKDGTTAEYARDDVSKEYSDLHQNSYEG